MKAKNKLWGGYKIRRRGGNRLHRRSWSGSRASSGAYERYQKRGGDILQTRKAVEKLKTNCIKPRKKHPDEHMEVTKIKRQKIETPKKNNRRVCSFFGGSLAEKKKTRIDIHNLQNPRGGKKNNQDPEEKGGGGMLEKKKSPDMKCLPN